MNTREKTNSITHLVKIVAKEVIEDMVISRLKELEECAHYHISPRAAFPFHSGNKLNRQGDPWSADEDNELDEEFSRAVQWMATKHGRTTGAIRARLELRRK